MKKILKNSWKNKRIKQNLKIKKNKKFQLVLLDQKGPIVGPEGALRAVIFVCV